MRHEASNSVCSYVNDTIKLLLSQVLFYFFLENEEKPVLNHVFESDCHPNCHPIPHFWCQYGCRRRLPPKLPPDTALLVPIWVPKAITTQIATRYHTSGANTGAEGNYEVGFKRTFGMPQPPAENFIRYRSHLISRVLRSIRHMHLLTKSATPTMSTKSLF